jgi:predicted MFS family arabinose efflux permease
LADRVGEERILPLALLVIGGGYLMLVDLEGSGRLLLSGMVTGVGQGLVFPCFLALALRNEPIGDRGKINGAFTGGLDLGLFGGSLLLGWIGQRAGYGPLFLMAGAFVWAGLLYFLARILPLVSKRSVNPPLDSL